MLVVPITFNSLCNIWQLWQVLNSKFYLLTSTGVYL